MELQIAGTNIVLTAPEKQYIERKLAKLDRHLPDIIDIKVEVSQEKTRSPQAQFLVRMTVNGGIGGKFHGEERAEDTRKAVDRVISIMTRQIEKQKGKIYDKGRGNPLARGKFPGPGTPETPGKVVETRRVAVDAMSPEEAIERLSNSGQDILVFRDDETDEIRVLYRKDSDYGLIEEEPG